MEITKRKLYTKIEKGNGLEGHNDVKNLLPSHLRAFMLSSHKRIMNRFIKEINGFYSNNIYYGDTVSLYIEKKYWDLLDKANLIGNDLCQGKNDYETGGTFYGFFLAPRMK